MILQFVEVLHFSKVLILLIWTQFKPIEMQVKVLKFFLGGSTPKQPHWGKGGLRATKYLPATLGPANMHMLTTLAFPIGAWQTQL